MYVPFICERGEFLNEVGLPLPDIYFWDIPIPAEVMDPENSHPGSTWSIATEFRLQENEEGEISYIQTSLLDHYLK